MGDISIFKTLSAPFAIFFHIAMFFMMNEYRYPRKKAAMLTVLLNIPILVLTIIIYLLLGSERGGQLALFFYIIPQLAVACFLSRYRDGRLFSTYFFTGGIFVFIIQITNLMDQYSPYDNHIVMLLSRIIICSIAFLFLYKFVSKPYRRAICELNEGWNLFSYISAMFTVLLLVEFNFPDTLSKRPYDIPVLIITFGIMLLSNIYYFEMLLKLLDHFRQYELYRYQKQQMELTQERIEHMIEAEKTLSIYRHDMRHILTTLSGMISDGLYDEADHFIEKHISPIEETSYAKWCEDGVLNSMFCAYFAEAKKRGIEIDAQIDLKRLSEDESAMFSIMCANAIENAIHAVSQLSDKRKFIRVRAVCFPKLMFSVGNPYEGNIKTNDEGVPVSGEEGHGIGILSILDYCEKNDAMYDFKIEDGWFSVRVAKR